MPLRIAIGPRDLENNTIELARRDTLEKSIVDLNDLGEVVPKTLKDIQQNLFAKALKHRSENSTKVDSWDEFKEVINGKGGFVLAHWDGSSETEEKIKQETKATIRCIPLDAEVEEGECVYTGKPSSKRVIFAKAY